MTFASNSTNTRSRLRYISRVVTHGHVHYVVRVPRTKDAFWPRESFSESVYGEDACRMAIKRRDFFISQTPVLPSGLVSSRTAVDIDPELRAQAHRLFHFQEEFSQIKGATVAMLAMFAGREATCRDIAAAIGCRPDNLANQLRLLERKGWLSVARLVQGIGRPTKIYTLAPDGWTVLNAFRSCFGTPESKLVRSPCFYTEAFLELRHERMTIGPAMLAVLMVLQQGVSAVAEIARVLDTTMPEVSVALSRADAKGFLAPAKQKPVFEVSDAGLRIMELFNAL